jgi:chemotaxis protein MotB
MNKEREVPVRIVIRKKKAHGGSHGGAWKVAFADFMTAMFAMFLVLWLVNQSSDVKSAIAGYFQDPLGRADEFGSSILKGDGAQAATVHTLDEMQVLDLRRNRLQNLSEHVQEKIKELPEFKKISQYIEIAMTDEGLQIQLLEDSSGVFFESGGAAPSSTGREILSVLGEELGKLPNPVLVDGFTDARPYASPTYSNWELSADRANAARRVLEDGGLHAGQVQQIRGMADRNLHDPAHPLAAANRRVTITMLLSPEPATTALVGDRLKSATDTITPSGTGP